MEVESACADRGRMLVMIPPASQSCITDGQGISFFFFAVSVRAAVALHATDVCTRVLLHLHPREVAA